MALTLADPALWEFRRTLLAGLTSSKVNSVALGRQWIEFVDEAGKESAAKRQRAAQALRLLIQTIQDALAVAEGSEPREIEADDLKPLSKLAQLLGTEQLLELQQRCLDADMHLDRRVQLELVVEALTDALGKRVNAAV
jgi:DNA polymerase-3 subunit delta'